MISAVLPASARENNLHLVVGEVGGVRGIRGRHYTRYYQGKTQSRVHC